DVSQIEIVKAFTQSQGRTAATVPFVINTSTGQKRMLGTYTGISDTDWGVIVQIDQEKAYYSALRMRDQSLGLVAVVAVLALVLGTLFAGEISRPIHELAVGANRLAGGDYSTRVAVRTQNEVGTLALAFNQMGEEIQKS